MTEPTAYPLAWPPGWPRTARRVNGAYKTSLAGALTNLRKELRLLCGEAAAKTLVLSSNATLGNESPTDSGVCAYVTWDGETIGIPCDRWLHLAQNVQAIALAIKSMRAIERHGAKHMVKAMFRGFTALPAPDHWREELGNPATLLEAESEYRTRMQTAHPDKPGGSQERAAALNAAIASARKEFGNG